MNKEHVRLHTPNMADSGIVRTCFMAMPITTHPKDVDRYGGDSEHWRHVMSSLFVKAIETAGFKPIPPVAQGAHMIHGEIIKNLSTADLVLVDLSSHNPNVFFELGVRTSLNLPIALVMDEHTDIPFDTSGINTYTYDSNLRGWEIESQQQSLAQHVRKSHDSCSGQNPLWRQFGLTIKAQEPDAKESPLEAKMDLLTSQMLNLQARLEHDREIREHERILLQGEITRSIDNATWSQLQQQDPSRNAPARLFAEAVNRTSRARVVPISPTEALVELEGRVTNDEVDRIRELATRYEVNIQIRDSGLSSTATDEQWRGTPGRDDGRANTGTSRARDRLQGRQS